MISGDGKVTVEDMTMAYNVKEHPKVKNGEWTDTRAYKEYLSTFEAENQPDGVVSLAGSGSITVMGVYFCLYVLLAGGGGGGVEGAVAQTVERATSGEEVPGSISAVAARSHN